MGLELIMPGSTSRGNISAAARKMSYFAVICWQSAIWRGGSSGNQSRVQCGKIGGIARIVGGNKMARSQVSKLGVTCPLFALLAIEISHCGQKTKHQWQQHWKFKIKGNFFSHKKSYYLRYIDIMITAQWVVRLDSILNLDNILTLVRCVISQSSPSRKKNMRRRTLLSPKPFRSKHILIKTF